MKQKCVERDCREVQEGKRCYGHERDYKLAQEAKKAKYQDPLFRKVREHVKRLRAQGAVFTCCRCRKAIRTDQPCDIDHLPDGSLGTAHASCNRREGGKNSYALQKAQGRPPLLVA